MLCALNGNHLRPSWQSKKKYALLGLLNGRVDWTTRIALCKNVSEKIENSVQRFGHVETFYSLKIRMANL